MAVIPVPHVSEAEARSLFEQINLDYPGLEPVKAACAQGLWDLACEELAAYYRQKACSSWFIRNNIRLRRKVSINGESILRGIFCIQNVSAANPRLADGGFDWSWRGPRNDIEWTYFLNRHYFFMDAIGYHHADGDQRYLDFIVTTLADWLDACPCPDQAVAAPQWRVFEAAIRVGTTWPHVFYYLQGHSCFDIASQVRMLHAIVEHGRFVRAFHTNYRNHATMEVCGLLRASLYWPELAEADEWRRHAWDHLTYILEKAIYPDGVHKELSSHYHRTTLAQYLSVIDHCRYFNCEVPELIRVQVDHMIEYLAGTMTPGGNGLLNNDGDLEDTRSFLKKKSQVVSRPPDGTPSRLYPWAGHVVMRNNWMPDAQWLFFDAGPAGVAHQHEDKLHVSVHAGGRDLLVDCGRYTYKPGRMRDYFVSSASHNVILVNGCGQRRGKMKASPAHLAKAVFGTDEDYAIGAHEAGYHGLKGKARHERVILYIKNRLWIVADTVEYRKCCTIDALWHFHPDCNVIRRGHDVVTVDRGKGNLAIIPVAPTGLKWRPRIIKGRRWFGVQGWWSPTYNEIHPAPCAVYRAKIDRIATFAWLLIPCGDEPPPVAARVLSTSPHIICMAIEWPDGECLHAAIRTAPGHPLVLPDGTVHDRDFILSKVADGRLHIIESS